MSSLRVLCLWTTFGRRRVYFFFFFDLFAPRGDDAFSTKRTGASSERNREVWREGEREERNDDVFSTQKEAGSLVGFDLDLVQKVTTMNSALKESSFSSSSSKGREESKVEKNDDDTRERASSFSSSSSSSSKALSRTTTTWKSRRVGRLSPPSPPYTEREREREREREKRKTEDNTHKREPFRVFFNGPDHL